MKQFGTIFKFELNSYFKSKAYMGVTIFLVILIAALMFFPRITASQDGGEAASGDHGEISVSDDETADPDRPVMYVLADTEENTETICLAFAAAFPEYSVQATAEGLDWIKAQITSEQAECAFVLDSLTSYTYYVNNLSMYDSNTAVADEILLNAYRVNAMMGYGMTGEDAEQIMTAQIDHDTFSLGKDQFKNFFYTYIMIFALYMVILLYGQMVTTNVAAEKSSRAMELLITSAKPTSMMFGKVIASCLAGLIQLIAVFGCAFLSFNLNRAYWDGNEIISSIFDIPIDLLVYMLIFFILGFFIYAFLYGAIGSTVSKVEDVNTSVMPLTMLFIIAFVVVVFSMSSGSVDNLVIIICSYIPFTSPMAMFTRIAMSTVPLYQIIISIAILIASVVCVGVLAAKIYRVGVLLYGTKPKPGAILKAIRKA